MPDGVIPVYSRILESLQWLRDADTATTVDGSDTIVDEKNSDHIHSKLIMYIKFK